MKLLIDPGPSEAGWHRIQSVMKCPTLYQLSRTTPWPSTEPLVKGSLVHVGLAHLYKQKQLRDKGKNWGKYYDPHEAIAVAALNGHAESDSDLWMELAPVAQRTLREYVEYWAAGGDLDRHWKVLSVERELRCHVTDVEQWQLGDDLALREPGDPPSRLWSGVEKTAYDAMNQVAAREAGGSLFKPARYLYTQRADLIVQHRKTGKVFIVDHKTASRPIPNVMRRHGMTGQFLGYRMFGSLHYKDSFGGVVVNAIRILDEDTVLKKPQFKRPILERVIDSHTKLKTTIIHAERLIREYSGADTWPHALHEAACWEYGGCPMHGVCQYGPETEEED